MIGQRKQKTRDQIRMREDGRRNKKSTQSFALRFIVYLSYIVATLIQNSLCGKEKKKHEELNQLSFVK